MSAVVDAKAFSKIARYIDLAKASKDAEVIAGGTCTVMPNPYSAIILTFLFVDDNTTGYYVQPTIILAKDPKFVTMVEEIFGPVLTIYVYKASEYESMVRCV